MATTDKVISLHERTAAKLDALMTQFEGLAFGRIETHHSKLKPLARKIHHLLTVVSYTERFDEKQVVA